MAEQDPPQGGELPSEAALVTAAIAGDHVALERLLLSHYDSLARRIGAKLPARLQATQAVEDILQQTFLEAFRDVRNFQPRNDASFGDWLVRIAEHRLLDAIKHHDRRKRGGGWGRIEGAAPDDSGLVPLLDWLAGDETPPSRAAARDEALQALQIALAGLEHDQREAIRMRLLEGMSLEDVAAALGKTPDAVRGLVHRGKQKLRDAMGRASQWLSARS
jgi:RNA polymerase sigma-70 factor (ECF subfamily)